MLTGSSGDHVIFCRSTKGIDDLPVIRSSAIGKQGRRRRRSRAKEEGKRQVFWCNLLKLIIFSSLFLFFFLFAFFWTTIARLLFQPGETSPCKDDPDDKDELTGTPPTYTFYNHILIHDLLLFSLLFSFLLLYFCLLLSSFLFLFLVAFESQEAATKRLTERQFVEVRDRNMIKLAQIKAEYEQILTINASAPGIILFFPSPCFCSLFFLMKK